MGRERQLKRLRRPTRVTAADAFPNAKRGRDAEVTKRRVPQQDHVAETERYFARVLESSVPTGNEESEMPTLQNQSDVQRKCGVMGENRTSCAGVNDEREQEPRGGGGRPQRERRGDSITPLGRRHQEGEEGGGGGGSYDYFPGVEISIAGGVGEMVRVTTVNVVLLLSFFFFFNLDY